MSQFIIVHYKTIIASKTANIRRIQSSYDQIYLNNKHKKEWRKLNLAVSIFFSPCEMSFLFGSSKTPAEMLRQNQRALNKAIRELDRERQKLEQSEKKLIADIKKSARAGQNVGFFKL